MATRLEINQLGKQLGSPSIEWVVCGRPVVALFYKNKTASPVCQEQEHLGQPSLRNGESDTLLLWIGLDEKAGHAFITLTQRLSSNNKGRLLYLIIPSESLSMKVDAPAYWTLSHENVPSTSIDKPSDDRSAHEAQLLRMCFELSGFSHSRVLMPSTQVTTHIVAQRALLLSKLKALSEVSRFDLFTNYDSHAAQNVRRAQSLLDQGRIITPSVSLTGFYLGSRDAVYDRWENEGWCNGTTTKANHKRILLDNQPPAYKRPRCLVSTPDGMPSPPPYEPSASPLLPPTGDGAPFAAVAPAPTVTAKPSLHVPSTLNVEAGATKAAYPSLPRLAILLHLQIPAWLTHAWSLCPEAHYIFVTELLALCAASLDHDTTRFDKCRVAANHALLSHWAAGLHKKHDGVDSALLTTCSVKKHRVNIELSALLSWLSILDRQADVQSALDGQADLELSGNLKALASGREVFLNCESDNEDEYYKGYVKARAWFVTKACLRLGASVLKRDKDIKTRMIQEIVRLNVENKCHEC